LAATGDAGVQVACDWLVSLYPLLTFFHFFLIVMNRRYLTTTAMLFLQRYLCCSKEVWQVLTYILEIHLSSLLQPIMASPMCLRF